MQTESLGKVLPRILFPYVQQWAERSGMTLLSRLLVDEQFRALIEKYGDEIVTRMAQAAPPPYTGNGRGNGSRPASRVESHAGGADANANANANPNDLTSLHDRVLAMEAQQEAQQALFESLRTKIRPLALALGCCPECVVGVDACPRCWGRSRVGHYRPDFALLESHIIKPLAARGVPLVLRETAMSSAGHHTKEPVATRKRSRPWTRN